MPSVRLSPGRLTALWVVLRTLHRLGGSATREELRRNASRTSLRSGGLPVGDGLTLALEGRFLGVQDERVSIATLGREALALTDQEEPSDEVRHLFTSTLLLRDPPTWVAFWQGDPTSLPLAIPDAERLLLEDCGLYPEARIENLVNWAWWDALRQVPLPEEAGEYRKLLGDAGEQLTVAYEHARLEAEGYPELSARVRWVARESAAYGFDVLSFFGKRDAIPSRPLAIEVKSIARGAADVFPLYLTEHEWKTSQQVGAAYVFHLWDGVDPGPPPRSTATPRIVMPPMFEAHVPSPPACGRSCSWATARIDLPLRESGSR